MENKRVYLTLIVLFAHLIALGQKKRFELSTGYGLAGSFLTRSIVEEAPSVYPEYTQFARMNFLGTAQNIRIGYDLGNMWSINFGIHFQHFTRKVAFTNTLNEVDLNIDKTIHHRDYTSFAGMQRTFPKQNHRFSIGLGLYYLRAKSELIEMGADFYNNIEATFQNANANEIGIFPEASYSFAFQPRVFIGVKSQFFYTLSAMYAESITCLPFIQLKF